jgi:cell division protein FtsI (penicillin-binding protein 3)
VASFAGFAPINDPAITVAVILDSAVGLHQGGRVSAPVFSESQQVLGIYIRPTMLSCRPAARSFWQSDG